jgi:acyl dehydratase
MSTASRALLPNSIRNRFISTNELRPSRSLGVSPRAAAGGIVGGGFDELRWPRSVRPGDELRVESEVLEVRASKSRPAQGVIKVRTTTLNQDNQPVQVFVGNLIVPRRPVRAS